MRRLMRIPFKRKNQKKTDYKKRLKLLITKKPRVVVRKSLNNILVQITKFSLDGDKIEVSANSRNLVKLGWKYHRGNVPAAYLTGLLCGVKAKQKNIKEAVLDIGIYPSIKGSVLYASLKGLVDAGLKINHSKEILPSEDKISGKHITDYAQLLLKTDKEKYKKQFSKYIKNQIKPEEIPTSFQEVKNLILKGDKK